eukprot:XP_008654186.1 isoflavone reductase homolog [Zea mays]
MEKSRVLVVGGTGYIGRRLVRASLAQGHPTLVLLRAEIGLDIDKLQMLLSFKAQGARLVEASLEDHAGLLAAVAHANVVVSAMSGAHIRNHNSPKGDTGRLTMSSPVTQSVHGSIYDLLRTLAFITRNLQMPSQGWPSRSESV